MTGAARWREQREQLQEQLAQAIVQRDEIAAERDQYRRQYEQAAEEIARVRASQPTDEEARVRALEGQVEVLFRQLREALKLIDLQEADLARYRAAVEASTPHRPERVPAEELERVLERVLADLPDVPGANDGSPSTGSSESVVSDPSSVPGTEATTETCAGTGAGAPANGTAAGSKTKAGRGRHPHGRRRLDLTKLPVVTIEIVPEEVRAAGGEGYERIGEETSDRLAFRPGSYVRLRIVRPTFVAVSPTGEATATKVGTSTEPVAEATASTSPAPRPGGIWCAPLPGCIWPYVMADPSAVAHVIVSKYDDLLPLNRQERISAREGFMLPRSTQCGWLGAAFELLYRIVDAMWDEARRKAFCIATDATGAPVRAKGECVSWHLFVMIADRDHIVFRPTREHTSATMEAMFEGFQGRLLADAAPIYDVLYREHDLIEVGCWSHARRYFWRALDADRERAMEALAFIAKLFDIADACKDIPMPERTRARAARAGPVLALFDRWIERQRAEVDPRGPLDKAIGYYTNQREALHQFLTDGRLRLDNNLSEQQLRSLVQGRANWTFFENPTGLSWYATFRSLIASCVLHGLNAEQYLEEVLRLAPHWPVTRVLELAPKYWASTRAGLDAHQRAILARPWELEAAISSPVETLAQAA